MKAGTAQAGQELVVLLDEEGNAIGTQDKSVVHTQQTPLHLAFSCYVFDCKNRLLLSRRAFSKKTWPGVWTNSCCGHPGPGERPADAVRRRLADELGIQADGVDLILPRFRYRAVMADGIVENEMCPVYRAVIDQSFVPNPEEVAEFRWLAWNDLAPAVTSGAIAPMSPWCLEQLAILAEFGADVSGWPGGDEDELPPAARIAN